MLTVLEEAGDHGSCDVGGALCGADASEGSGNMLNDMTATVPLCRARAGILGLAPGARRADAMCHDASTTTAGGPAGADGPGAPAAETAEDGEAIGDAKGLGRASGFVASS